jgi:hypothetical protein
MRSENATLQLMAVRQLGQLLSGYSITSPRVESGEASQM